MTFVEIAGRRIGAGQPCFVIAEAGVNHNGNIELAKNLIDVAKKSGADAVKFQTFRSDLVVSPEAPKAAYQKDATGADQSQLDMVRQLELPFAAFEELARYAQSRGILFLSTPFDSDSIEFLDALGVAAFKVPSGEVTNIPYLRHVARKKRPMIISTGMATLSEVREAVDVVRLEGAHELVLLHCVSNYPAAPADVNLRAMHTMADAFGVPTGYSDHTLGTDIALAAVALGASVIEKHFTLDRAMPGPDHRASLEPDELRAMVEGIRHVQSALGDGVKAPVAAELDTARVARRSLVAARALPAGTVIEESMVAVMRPGTGLPPRMLAEIVGRQLRCAVAAGGLFSLEMFD